MRFFNDVFDLGIKDERALNIINFFFFFHLVLFVLVFGYAIKMAVRGDNEAFGDEVEKMKKRIGTDETKKAR